MHYILAANPSTETLSLDCLRSRAKRRGYRVQIDRASGGTTFTLYDARLRRPISGLDHVPLNKIADAIEMARINT
jgi:hypothetical protein